METLIRDARSVLILLKKEPTFATAVLLTLAVCIGANVAIFSVIHAVLLEPLPFHEPDRLVSVFNSYPGAGSPRASNGSVDFFQRREHVAAFEEVALYNGSGATVGEAGSTERVATMVVTPSFFPLLGVEAALGRTFTEDEMEAGNELKVVLTDAYWRERFGGAPDAIGRELRVNGRPHTVVGVLPEDFETPQADARFYVPIAFSEADRQLDRWHSNNFSMMARLRPGATIEQARAQNLALNDALIDQWPLPSARQILQDAGYTTLVVDAQADLVRDVASTLYMLWAGVGFVLLIGCVNIANLMLARAQSRTSEVATRLALGAPRRRVARQVLTESMVLGLLGGALGVGLGALGLRLLRMLGAADLPRGTAIGIDASVVLFTLALALGAGILFGSIPLLQIMRRDLTRVFRAEGSRGGTSSRGTTLVRDGLVTSQVALAFVLLIGAGLMLLSFRAALSVDPGFEPEGVLTAFVSLPSARYSDEEARRQLVDEVLREVRATPGVEAAGITSQLPFSGNNSNSVIMPLGYVPGPGESLLSPMQTSVTPDYFETLGIELVEGRTILDSDGPDGPNVVVIDEWLARRYWPDRSPLGDRMFQGVPGMDSIPEDDVYTVVGVVGTIKQNDLTAPEGEHVGAYYFAYPQETRSFLTLVVRSSGEPTTLTPGLRQILAGIDPELPLFGVETMQARIDESLARRRVPLVLLGVFAGVALFLAVVGIYGALAYSVSQRNREIGIRMAMGSAPDAVFRSVVAQGMRLTGLGLAFGAVTALVVTRLVQSLLFGVQATDLRVVAGVGAVLALAALVACLVPARRATAVDPVRALSG